MSEFLIDMRRKWERGTDGASQEVVRLLEMCEHDQAEIANLRRQLEEMTQSNNLFVGKAADLEREIHHYRRQRS